MPLWLLIWIVLLLKYVTSEVVVYRVGTHQPENRFPDMPASFGRSLPYEGLLGYLVIADPPYACGEIKGPPTLEPNFQWIVLIKRYGCFFEDKVRNAQNANFSAAIIYNNASGLEQMSANDADDIVIPSIFVNNESGYMLTNYQYDQSFYLLLNDESPFNFNTHLLLPFAIVVGVCFIIIIVFLIVKCVKEHRRQRRHRLPSSSLKKIPTAKYQKGDPYETCAICLEDFLEGDKLRILPCSHAYHCKCIDPWLTRNRRVCPVCKRKVFAQDEHISETESDTDTDDTTPLLRPNSYGTQGGTFTTQNENPLRRSLGTTSSHSSLSSMSSQGQIGQSHYNSETDSQSQYCSLQTETEPVLT